MGRITLQTELCNMLGIKYPIIQAGMASTAGPTLAAAVSNAGGLGVLGCTPLEPEAIRSWIRRTRNLTDKPFGVDILMPAVLPAGMTEEQLWSQIPQRHIDFVEQLKKEYGVPDVDGENYPLTMEFVTRQFDAVLEENVPVFCTGLGTPDWLIPKAQANGMKVISLVGNVRNAIRMNKQGVDIIVAQGYEAGGHTGRIGTMALVPQVVDAVAPTPVIAGGGIGDGRGLVAALALGAVGVWLGTAFVVAEEAFVEAMENNPGISVRMRRTRAQVNRYQRKCIESDEENTIVTRGITGKTCRLFKSELIEKWERSGLPSLGMPLQGVLMASLIAGLDRADLPFTPAAASAGQITGLLKKVKPARQIIEEMVEQAKSIID